MDSRNTPKPRGPTSQRSAGTMSSPMTLKSELNEDYNLQEVLWQDDAKDRKNNSKDSSGKLPAEICVVIGGPRSPQTLGSYMCGICGKKYKYYNCFQTHVRAHRETETGAGEGSSQGATNPYDQAVIPVDDPKEEEPTEPFQKIGPKTGNYICEFCGKQYKYFNPYQEHVALHAPISWSIEMQAPRSRLRPASSSKRGAPQTEHSQIESAFCRKAESKTQNSVEETNSSQNSSGGTSPLISNPFPLLQKPYTCGACGIQFQFYNNLLEHMQSHAADNENSVVVEQLKTSPAPAPAPAPTPAPASAPAPAPAPVTSEQQWKSPPQRNHTTNSNGTVPEKERQQIAERLLKVMYADLGAASVLNTKDFMKLAQTLVDTGARYGAFSVTDVLGDMNKLALKHLPRMYNQVKVKVTCALGSNTCLGIGVTCHSQVVGADSCYVLTAYQVEGIQRKRYVLGVKEVDVKECGEQVHHWVQNVLSEFVMSEIRTIYVTDCKVSLTTFFKAGMCLGCSACALNCVVQSALSKRTLQARSMHEVIDLLNVCEDMAGSAGLSRETFGSLEEASPPPCWDSVTESLLLVNERYEQICEFYSRAKKMSHIQNLNKQLLCNLAAILAPVKQAVVELSCEQKPTLQLVLPTYVKLEKLFTVKANDVGAVSKLCHFFLEALKENFKMERAHKVAMILDPQQKLRPVPAYQHEEIISKVCEMITEIREMSGEVTDMEPSTKKARLASSSSKAQGSDEKQVKKEVYEYLAEPLFQATPDLFQYWSSVTQRYPRLARLAFWLLSVPAVGARSESVSMCEQALSMKRRRQVTPEEMNKLIFLKSNMS
ncbi:zinc finger protein 618-like isoform X2 [Polyodon spathula]|uniref:zinc finger protein 618-like isoform X2 n=1 Tax=Polyodon spathula TaxID=7913 RepID=UPI001B7DB7F0|nr:zinc finger protein 618-like isoform X2 [Polyodon spathula]